MRQFERLGVLAYRQVSRDCRVESHTRSAVWVRNGVQATECTADQELGNRGELNSGPDGCGNVRGLPEECCPSERHTFSTQANGCNLLSANAAGRRFQVHRFSLRSRPLDTVCGPVHQPSVRGFAASALSPVGTAEVILRERFVPAGGFLALNNIRDNPGAKKEKKRLGRGTGSGLGKTSGRGHKGQKARAGRKPRAGFEGGQTPLRLSIPKRGFHNPFSLDFQVVNLNRLSEYIERGKIDPNGLITMKTLKDAGAIGKAMRDGVKLLGRGSDEFKHPIKIEVSRVSEQARKTIEAAGGTVTTVYYNKLGLRALYKPEWFIKKGRLIPRPARPPPKMRGKTDTIGRLPAPTTPLELESDG